MIAIKPERILELLAERLEVGGISLTLSVRHILVLKMEGVDVELDAHSVGCFFSF